MDLTRIAMKLLTGGKWQRRSRATKRGPGALARSELNARKGRVLYGLARTLQRKTRL